MTHSLSHLLAALDGPSRGAASRRRSAAPRLEVLESRVTPSTIAGVVYNDVAGTGLFQPGDPVYANNPISLANAAGTVIASTVTDANGHYAFSVDPTISTAPATQEQDLVFGPNLTDTPQSLQINQFNPALGTLTGVDIVQDATVASDVQAANTDPIAFAVSAQIQGTVTLQAPGANTQAANVQATESATIQPGSGATPYDFGVKDADGTSSISLNAATSDLSAFIGTGQATVTETGTAGVDLSGPGNFLAMVRSTYSGQVKVVYHYTPSNALQPGQYTVIETANPPGTTDGVDSSNGVPVPPGTPADAIPVTLPPGGDSLSNDFGKLTTAKVSGFVYVDNNLDGVFDAGDTPIPGAIVNISRLNPDGSTTFVATTQTAADGSYSFTEPTGTYTITQNGRHRPDPRRGQHRQPWRLFGPGRPDPLPAGRRQRRQLRLRLRDAADRPGAAAAGPAGGPAGDADAARGPAAGAAGDADAAAGPAGDQVGLPRQHGVGWGFLRCRLAATRRGARRRRAPLRVAAKQFLASIRLRHLRALHPGAVPQVLGQLRPARQRSRMNFRASPVDLSNAPARSSS